MVHNHYLEEAKKKTQESGRNSRPSVMPSARSQSTANELRIHDHNNEPSSSKLVPKVVPSVDTTAPSKQELDLLFGPLYDKFFTAATAQSTTELITPTTTITAEDNM
ncbi:hypothetical protein Tco_1074000 [Tanacetum coccineum]